MARRVILLIGCLGVAFLGGAAPDERGPFDTEDVAIRVEDAARQRGIDLLVVYPVGAPGPSPLIAFVHGFLLSGEGYRSYGEHLASHGFVVALPTLRMNPLDVDHGQLAEDVRLAIDVCVGFAAETSHPLSGRIDAERIGLSGHSLGGKLSLLVAFEDARVLAAALLDPVDGGPPGAQDSIRYPSVAPERMGELEIPLLFLGAELGSRVAFLAACAPEAENYERFFEAANPPAIEVTQVGVGHGQYLDDGFRGLTAACAVGDVPDAWVRASSASSLTAFFLGTLGGSREALGWLDAWLAAQEALGRLRVRRK